MNWRRWLDGRAECSQGWWVGAAVVGFLCIGQDAKAIGITVTDATPIYVATVPYCAGGPVMNQNCTSTAHLNLTSLTDAQADAGEDFRNSFDAWTATADGAGWTLAKGGALPGGELKVTIFDAYASYEVGGLEISIDWTYAGADKNQFFWTQGLYDNYLLDGSIVPPFYEMDVVSNAACASDPFKFCPPLYPFQYVDRHFYDFPAAPWPNSFFYAETFLSKVNYTTKVLTIYEGVEYDFQLSAQPTPEPATLLLMLPCLAAYAVRRWREKRRS